MIAYWVGLCGAKGRRGVRRHSASLSRSPPGAVEPVPKLGTSLTASRIGYV